MGLPPLDFAFNIVGWLWCMAGNQSKGFYPVEVTGITVPEDHIKRVKLVEAMTSQFQEIQELAEMLKVREPKDL
jgi:hypothetical protein